MNHTPGLSATNWTASHPRFGTTTVFLTVGFTKLYFATSVAAS
uniref:Uncharacterized protein n=1 Tax=Arundo donax TaxID=35708 RepID=A0A0A8Z1A2_ARUDO